MLSSARAGPASAPPLTGSGWACAAAMARRRLGTAALSARLAAALDDSEAARRTDPLLPGCHGAAVGPAAGPAHGRALRRQIMCGG